MGHRVRYPSRTVAAARALHRLKIGPTLIGKLLNIPKEAVSAWVHQNWRAGTAADETLHAAILAIIAPAVFHPEQDANPADSALCQPGNPAEEPVCQPEAVEPEVAERKLGDIQPRTPAPVARRVVCGRRY